MEHFTRFLGLVFTTMACAMGCGDSAGDSAGDPAGDGQPTEAGDPSAPDDPFLALSECDEADFVALPWTGSAFDSESGELIEPLRPPYVIASTVGWAKTDPEAIEMLGDSTGRIIDDALAREGLLGGTFGSSRSCGAARTLTIWRDEESMLEFVWSGLHLEAISLAEATMQSFGHVHWTETESTVAPTWTLANARILETRSRS